jgi:hypothetical protein
MTHYSALAHLAEAAAIAEQAVTICLELAALHVAAIRRGRHFGDWAFGRPESGCPVRLAASRWTERTSIH